MLISQSQLEQLLLKQHYVNEETLGELSLFAKNSQISLQDAIVEKGILSDSELGQHIASTLKVPFFELSKTTIRKIQVQTARENGILSVTSWKEIN